MDDFIKFSRDLTYLSNVLRERTRELSNIAKKFDHRVQKRKKKIVPVAPCVDDFLIGEYEFDDAGVEMASDVYRYFKEWCHASGISNPYTSQRAFGLMMGQGFQRFKRNGIVHYRGLKRR